MKVFSVDNFRQNTNFTARLPRHIQERLAARKSGIVIGSRSNSYLTEEDRFRIIKNALRKERELSKVEEKASNAKKAKKKDIK